MEDFRLKHAHNKQKTPSISLFEGDKSLKKLFEDQIEHFTKPYRNRVYTPSITMQMFITQKLKDTQSCKNVVQSVLLSQINDSERVISFDTGAYCKARKRLPEFMMTSFVKCLGNHLESQCESDKWKGFSLKLIDGTALSMPDTLENQKEYPQRRSQKEGLGFPILRMGVIISLSSGAVVDYRLASQDGKGTGETSLLHKMIGSLKSTDLIVADRLYSNYFIAARLIQKGINFVMKSHIGRRIDFRRGRRLGKNDHIVFWHKPQRPSWMQEHLYNSLPDKIEIRETRKGKQTLSTSLLNRKQYTTAELVKIYSLRWQVETDLRNIKQTMGMDVLTCKTPSMIRKEIAAHLIAYNLVCYYMLKSSHLTCTKRRLLSYKNALNAVKLFVDFANIRKIKRKIKSFEVTMLIAINQCQVGGRPGRKEPRAVKRRPKPFSLLTQPRRLARSAI